MHKKLLLELDGIEYMIHWERFFLKFVMFMEIWNVRAMYLLPCHQPLFRIPMIIIFVVDYGTVY